MSDIFCTKSETAVISDELGGKKTKKKIHANTWKSVVLKPKAKLKQLQLPWKAASGVKKSPKRTSWEAAQCQKQHKCEVGNFETLVRDF